MKRAKPAHIEPVFVEHCALGPLKSCAHALHNLFKLDLVSNLTIPSVGQQCLKYFGFIPIYCTWGQANR